MIPCEGEPPPPRELVTGSVLIGGTDLARLSDGQLTTLRRDRLGFVFQAFNLIPTLTAEENITLGERIGHPFRSSMSSGEASGLAGSRVFSSKISPARR